MSREGAGRTALVTGASAGIGQAFAEMLAARGYALVLVARRQDRLEALASDLTKRHAVATSVIALDLADRAAPATIVQLLLDQGRHIDLLVNNAGYGVPGRYLASTWEVHRAFNTVLVDAVCELTYRLLPGMVERKWGRIVNVASLAGLVPSPAGHTLYAASKAYLIRFSESLAAEHDADGIHVTALCPGFTYSEFHDVSGMRGQVSQMPSWFWMDAATVAEQGYDAVMRGDVVYVNGRLNRVIARLARYLPQGLFSRLVARSGRRYRKV